MDMILRDNRNVRYNNTVYSCGCTIGNLSPIVNVTLAVCILDVAISDLPPIWTFKSTKDLHA